MPRYPCCLALLALVACSSESSDPPAAAAAPERSVPSADVQAAEGGGEFRMPVMDVFTITGRGVVMTGRIESGSVAAGDTVCLRAMEGGSRELVIAGIEMFRKVLESASAGDNVGLLVQGIDDGEVNDGDVLEEC